MIPAGDLMDPAIGGCRGRTQPHNTLCGSQDTIVLDSLHGRLCREHVVGELPPHLRPTVKLATCKLEPGTVVVTTAPDGDDFGIPLVSPTHALHRPGRRGAEQREVRGTCRTQGGVVVWFTDGTKSRPVHGRTTWMVKP